MYKTKFKASPMVNIQWKPSGTIISTIFQYLAWQQTFLRFKGRTQFANDSMIITSTTQHVERCQVSVCHVKCRRLEISSCEEHHKRRTISQLFPVKDQLQKSDKLKCLETYLMRNTVEATSGLLITKANYQAAVDLVEQAFVQEHLIINEAVAVVPKRKEAASYDNIWRLRILNDDVNACEHRREARDVKQRECAVFVHISLQNLLPKGLTNCAHPVIGEVHHCRYRSLAQK